MLTCDSSMAADRQRFTLFYVVYLVFKCEIHLNLHVMSKSKNNISYKI